ncbi:MAG: acyloxyacyl hydrolase [Phycisphaerae bacterium]|nr:acyloxyacyl hydrolase [Saprospiraceae bacterium]
MFKYLLVGLVLPVLSTAQSGVSQHPFQVGTKWHRGFIIPHSRELIDVSHSKPYGFEVNAHWLLVGEKEVRETGLIAKRGVAAYYFNFDNPAVLGHCVAVVPYVEPLVRPWGHLYGSFQLGLGAAYLSKVYDEQNNPSNLFFSLPVSFWAMLNADIYYKINPQWQAVCGFNYNHISNGGMKSPNKGMNFPTFNLGLQYALQSIEMKKPTKNNDWRSGSRNFCYLLAIGSVKNTPAQAGFPDIEPGILYGAQAMAGRRVGRMSALSAGIEFVHDGYDRILLDRLSDKTSTWKGGLMLGHELLIGRVRFTTHIGPYFYNPSRTTDVLYQRYGLFYRFGRHLLVGSTLKAHRHVADVFDLRTGWIW